MVERVCPKCSGTGKKFYKGKNLCSDCLNKNYNEKNKVKNYKGYSEDVRRGFERVKILNAAKHILKAGEKLSVRTIMKKIGSSNSGLVNYHFGSMNNLIIMLDKGLKDEKNVQSKSDKKVLPNVRK